MSDATKENRNEEIADFRRVFAAATACRLHRGPNAGSSYTRACGSSGPGSQVILGSPDSKAQPVRPVIGASPDRAETEVRQGRLVSRAAMVVPHHVQLASIAIRIPIQAK